MYHAKRDSNISHDACPDVFYQDIKTKERTISFRFKKSSVVRIANISFRLFIPWIPAKIMPE
jgi:hypothetical protein